MLYIRVYLHAPPSTAGFVFCGFDKVYHNNFTENSEENKFAVGFNCSNINHIAIKYRFLVKLLSMSESEERAFSYLSFKISFNPY